MKTPEELNTLRNEVETLNAKLAELTVDELVQVSGGLIPIPYYGSIGDKIVADGAPTADEIIEELRS